MTLKKLFLAAMASVLVSTGMQAQVENFEIFRHVGGNLNVGTEGIGFDVATPVTDYLEVSAGMSFMPGFKVDGDVNVKPIRITDVTTIPMESVNIEGKFCAHHGQLQGELLSFWYAERPLRSCGLLLWRQEDCQTQRPLRGCEKLHGRSAVSCRC